MRDIGAFEHNGTDTVDIFSSDAARKSVVDFIIDSALIPIVGGIQPRGLVRYALETGCPYISTNVQEAYRVFRIKAAPNVDKKRVCQCGLVFPDFTPDDHRHFSRHFRQYHLAERGELVGHRNVCL